MSGTQCETQEEKMKLRRNEVPYIGHVLTDKGLKPDPGKIQAMLEMPKPTDVARVQRLIGFVNYLSKFLPRLSDVCEPLRKLMAKEVEWHWTDHQDQAFQRIRQLVTEAPVLKYYEAMEDSLKTASPLHLPVEPCQTPRPDMPK